MVDNSRLTVKKVELDVPDLKRNLNCVVRMKRLSDDDINLWKPMPKPLAESDYEESSDSTDVNNTNCRRNPSRRVRDSVGYVRCQLSNEETDNDEGQSDHNSDDLFEPARKKTKTGIISLREPSKSRLEAQQQIAMKKAALVLLKLRNSSGGGVNTADKDLQDLSQTGIRQRTDYTLCHRVIFLFPC